MKKFGSAISYLTVDLIKIWKNSNENNFAENRDKYLAVEKPPDACYYRQLDYSRMQKIIQFIDRYIDSVTPENEMKMEEMFEQCSRFGVELQVTEFDVSNHSTKEIQQSIFNNFAEVAQKHGIEVFTTWGLNDIVSWLHGEEVSLVDSNCDLKPFTMKYIEAFSERYEKASREK